MIVLQIIFNSMNNGSYQGNNNDGRKIAADSEVFLDSLSRAITPLQNHLFIEDESQNFDEMRSVASSNPAQGRFRNFYNCCLASSRTVHFVRRYSIDRLCRMQMAAAILPEQPISTVTITAAS